MAVLTMGLLATGLIGIGMGYFSFRAWFQAMGSGITGMGELIIVTLLAGGVLSIIRFNGGIAYIIGKITAHIRNRRGAEFSICLLYTSRRKSAVPDYRILPSPLCLKPPPLKRFS